METSDGRTLKDARKFIYPRANRDPWWDTKQLLVQLKDAIDIFELKHPGCVGVFVFDQSSAHNSHGEGALNAFDMNLGPGGAVGPQNDTYYPPETATKVGEPQRLWIEELVEVVVNDGKVEVVKAETVGKGKKAPKAKGKRAKGKRAVNAELVVKNEPVIREGGVKMELQRVPKGGLHYGTAFLACALIAGNAWDGYLHISQRPWMAQWL